MRNDFEKEVGNWIRIPLLIFPYLFVVSGFQYVGGIILNVDITDPNAIYETQDELGLIFFGTLGIFFLLCVFMKFLDKRPIRALGLVPLKLKDIYNGLLIGLIVLSIGFFTLWASDEIQILGFNFITSDFFLSLCLYFLVAFSEEILVRGYVLSNLMGSVNKYVALTISSIIFSLMHIGNYGYSWFTAIELFTGGIMLGLPYLFNRNLWFPISLHFSWNFFQGPVFGFNVSGSNGYHLIQQSHVHNNIWNGGDFGFEGSIISIILQIFCISYFLFINKVGPRNYLSLKSN